MAKPRRYTGTEARQLLRRARTGTLATLNHGSGVPYASLVNVATDVDGRPIILVSRLAWHTRNLLADGRGSLLVAEPPPHGDALTGARVTVMGRFVRAHEPRLRRRYLGRHPAAETYVDFGDFTFWRLEPETIHAIAGFGRIETLAPDKVFPPAGEMAAIEDSAVAHMNEDHADAIHHYAVGLLHAEAGHWRIAAIDSDGADLTDRTRSLRLEFPEPVFTAATLRRCLAKLAEQHSK